MRLFGSHASSTPAESHEYRRVSIEKDHDESELEGWLRASPELLLDEPILIFGQQPILTSGVPDLLALDQFGNVVIFEVKTGSSGSKSASEESIIGQPLSYAQAIAPYEYGELDEIYQEYRNQLGEEQSDSTPGETLQAAFTEQFGRSLAHDQFNDLQRVVIIAEDITPRTADNARYLAEQGYNIQCREVQLFESSVSEGLVFASTTVVDYPLKRVRPPDKGHPAYPEINRAIVERAVRKTGSLIGADDPDDLIEGRDERQPRIRSAHPDHPGAVSYRLYVNPEQNIILIGLDIDRRDDDVLARIHRQQELFDRHGFEVTGKQRYRVVVDTWRINRFEDLDKQLIETIADQYATLVELGHQVFIDEL